MFKISAPINNSISVELTAWENVAGDFADKPFASVIVLCHIPELPFVFHFKCGHILQHHDNVSRDYVVRVPFFTKFLVRHERNAIHLIVMLKRNDRQHLVDDSSDESGSPVTVLEGRSTGCLQGCSYATADRGQHSSNTLFSRAARYFQNTFRHPLARLGCTGVWQASMWVTHSKYFKYKTPSP